MTRHRFDPFSFVVGLVVVVFALFFVSGARTPNDLGATWLWPVFILTPGALLVLTGVRRALEGRTAASGDESEKGTRDDPPDDRSGTPC